MTQLPEFPYHPRPLDTGVIVKSTVTCDLCHTSRGFIYAGPLHLDQPPSICPWCIADGSVYERFGPVLVGDIRVGGDIWCDVDDDTSLVVVSRTPGFHISTISAWAACCGDAAEYVETAGFDEIMTCYPDVVPELQKFVDVGGRGMPLGDWREWFKMFDTEGGPVAHIFRCKKCRRYTGYCDPD